MDGKTIFLNDPKDITMKDDVLLRSRGTLFSNFVLKYLCFEHFLLSDTELNFDHVLDGEILYYLWLLPDMYVCIYNLFLTSDLILSRYAQCKPIKLMFGIQSMDQRYSCFLVTYISISLRNFIYISSLNFR